MIVLLATISSSCLKSKKPGIPKEVLSTLNNSDLRKPDLLKVILAFQNPEDSLKLKSAYFLIQNLENNYSFIMSLSDSSENILDIDIESFPNYSSIQKYKESMEVEFGKLIYKTDSIWLDIDTINSGFLIEHINNSYSTWQNGTWESNYDFNVFLEYILPYRVANEEVEPFTKYFHKKYSHLTGSNIIETATVLNKHINSQITYDERYAVNPNTKNIAQCEETGKGNLLDINTYKVKALRSLGIAAALDYTPFFADSTLGFYSTTVILPDNSKLVLTNSDDIKTPYPQGKVAKVYRRSYADNPKSLFSIKDKSIHTPPFLGNYNYLDVTNEYLKTSDITVDCSDTLQFVYLAVFNEDEWKPVEWAKVGVDGKAHFLDMGTGVSYKLVMIVDEKVNIQIPNLLY